MSTTSTGSESRRDYHHGDLSRAIKAATLATIETEGLEAVSLRAIARRLGVSEAAPYHHFSSKDELLAQLAAEAYREFGERLAGAIEAAGKDPYDRLAALASAYIGFGLERRGRFRLMFGEHMLDLAAQASTRIDGQSSRLLLRDVVAACLEGTALDALSIERATWALVHGVTWLVAEAEIRFEDDADGVERLTDVAISILISGIRNLATGATGIEPQTPQRSATSTG